MARPIPHGVLGAVLGISLLILDPGSAEAQKKGKGPKAERAPAPEMVVEVSFSTFEREQIIHFYSENRMREAKPLPPGIRRNLARGKPLPPGIAKQVLPEDLVAVLPVREGYRRIQVGLDVLLVEVATGIIHDVLTDVIR